MAEANGASPVNGTAALTTPSQPTTTYGGNSTPNLTQSQPHSQPQTQSQSASQAQPSSQQTNDPSSAYYNFAAQPQTSTSDLNASSNSGPRPRDARTIHMVLTALGVTAYHERVPLQLLDFAYRYTASILSDAMHLSAEGYVPATGPGSGATGTGSGKAGGNAGNSAGGGAAEGHISIGALRLATTSRQGYQFSGALPKETLLELAAERNRVRLPPVEASAFGVRLPHERFVMLGQGWDMPEEWDVQDGDDEDEEEDEDGIEPVRDGGDAALVGKVNGKGAGNTVDADAEMEDDDADADGYQAVFGGEDGADEKEEDDHEMGDA